MHAASGRYLVLAMIGAYCHRLNLAATHWTNDAFDGKLQTCLDRIHAVMIRASNLKVGAEVRKYTDASQAYYQEQDSLHGKPKHGHLLWSLA